MLIRYPESVCHWLDTEGSFPPDRAKSVLESMGVRVSLLQNQADGRTLHRY